MQFPGAHALQNLHPLVVHYPIAFLTASVPIYFLAWILHSEALEWVGLCLLGLGALGAANAVSAGLWGSEGVMIAPSVREHILVYHEWFMIVVFALSAVLIKGADYGGWMVSGYNAGGSLPQPIEFAH